MITNTKQIFSPADHARTNFCVLILCIFF